MIPPLSASTSLQTSVSENHTTKAFAVWLAETFDLNNSEFEEIKKPLLEETT